MLLRKGKIISANSSLILLYCTWLESAQLTVSAVGDACVPTTANSHTYLAEAHLPHAS